MLPYLATFMLSVFGRIAGHLICKLIGRLHNNRKAGR